MNRECDGCVIVPAGKAGKGCREQAVGSRHETGGEGMGSAIDWRNSLSESIEAAKQEGKLVFIDFMGVT